MNKDITVIRTKEDWEKFYSYNKKYLTKSKYPKKYPCIAKIENEDCGIMGFADYHYVIYLPKNFEKMNKLDLFMSGIKQEWKCIT